MLAKLYNACILSLIISVALVCFCNKVKANDKEITWLILDQAPLYILKGSDRGKGVLDLLQQMLADNMQSFKQKIRVVNIARMIRELKNGTHVCISSDYYPTILPEIAINSLPTVLSYSRMAIFPTEKHKELGSPETVSFKQLLQSQKYVLGLPNGDKLGPELDPLLNAYGNEKNTSIRSSTDMVEGMLKMIIKGRIDYTIQYYFVYHYIAKKLGIEEKLVYIPIEEITTPFILGSISCPKTAWGEKTIYEINKSLLQIRQQPGYLQAIEEHHVLPARLDEYKKNFNERILSVTE